MNPESVPGSPASSRAASSSPVPGSTNNGPVRVNLGCGNKVREGFFGADLYPCEAADLLCDLTKPLPFGESTVDEFLLDNCIEHVRDIPALMRELVRAAKSGASITVITPHFTSASSWRDPTHVHHLSVFSFDHFGKDSVRHYMGGGVRIVKRHLSFGGGLLGLTGRLLFAISVEGWEKSWCFVFRASTIRWELRVEK
jgi:hypothetical protein